MIIKFYSLIRTQANDPLFADEQTFPSFELANKAMREEHDTMFPEDEYPDDEIGEADWEHTSGDEESEEADTRWEIKEHTIDVPAPNDGFFSISRLHRDDFKTKGYDASDVDDATMEQIAKRMGDTFVSELFWLAIEASADAYNMPSYEDRNENHIEMGDRVRWYDPDESARDLERVWRIYDFNGDVVRIKSEDNISEAEVNAEELELYVLK